VLVDYLDHWGWQALGDLIRGPGECHWRPTAALTQACPQTTNLLLTWRRGERQPWLLATNLPTSERALQYYKRRMWIEELFGDLKRHGFDLESSHLRAARSLDCLTLAVVLLYLWLVTEGTQALIQDRSAQVDRADRRDLSLFRLGFELIDCAITRDDLFQVRFELVFDPSLFSLKLVSGS